MHELTELIRADMVPALGVTAVLNNMASSVTGMVMTERTIVGIQESKAGKGSAS